MLMCAWNAIGCRVLSKITSSQKTRQDRRHSGASLGLGRVAETDLPAFERGVCAALTTEAPALAEKLQSSLMTTDGSCIDGTDVLILDQAVEEALGQFVQGYATRWGVWEGVSTSRR